MRSKLKNARNSASLIAVLFISVICVQSAQAQSPDTRAQDIQQLKDKLQQLEQMMGEVKGKITVLEGQPGTPSSEASSGESKNGPNDTLVSAVTSFDASPTAHSSGAAVGVPSLGKQADQKKPGSESTLDIYGFAMTDAGYNFGAIDPAWFDVVRPTKLPAFANEFGPNGQAFFSVRQTRFGVMRGANWATSGWGSTGVRSWISTSSRIPLSTGVLTEWCFLEMCNFGGRLSKRTGTPS
jgi:hypothetical protein